MYFETPPYPPPQPLCNGLIQGRTYAITEGGFAFLLCIPPAAAAAAKDLPHLPTIRPAAEEENDINADLVCI